MNVAARIGAALPAGVGPIGLALPRARDRAVDAALLVSLGALALAARLPIHRQVPIFTDETEDIETAFRIVRGELFPLVDHISNYNGSLWDWLLAGALLASGNSIHAPRALVLALGVLTVLATYPLGRAWSGSRAGGVLAAALLAASPTHIVVNSHVAWGNCITPLFTTLAVWCLWAGTRRRGDAETRGDGETGTRGRGNAATGDRHSTDPLSASPRLPIAASPSPRPGFLPLSGLFWGLALQTHPSVVALLVGAAIYLLWHGRPMLRTRWLGLAAALFLLVNLNIMIHNLTGGFSSLAHSQDRIDLNTRREPLTPSLYAERLGHFGVGLLRHLGGGVDQRLAIGPQQILGDPGLWPIAFAALAGLVWQWRRGNPLPGLLLGAMALIVPLVNQDFESLLRARYVGPLLPFLIACAAALLVEALARLTLVAGRAAARPGVRFGQAGLVLLTAFLLLHPLQYLTTYYAQEQRAGRTNEPLFRALEQIKARRSRGEPVLVDRPGREPRPGDGGGRASHAFHLGLLLQGVPHRWADLGSDLALGPADRCRDQLVAFGRRLPRERRAIAARLGLRRLDDRVPTPRDLAADYRVYRLPRLPEAVGCPRAQPQRGGTSSNGR